MFHRSIALAACAFLSLPSEPARAQIGVPEQAVIVTEGPRIRRDDAAADRSTTEDHRAKRLAVAVIAGVALVVAWHTLRSGPAPEGTEP